MSNGLLLWVDDEIELLKAHIIFLEKKGYEVVTVSNGADAIEQCRTQTFDLVLLDEQMPGLSGLETLQKMKEIQPATPIVMVTKSEEEDIMNQAIGAKIADYLIKPVNPSQILLTLKKNIHRREIVTEVTQTGYQHEYQQLAMQISDCRDFNDWVEVYKRLVKWELELSSADSNMTEMLTMQKEDANNGFAKYIAKNYLDWVAPNDGKGKKKASRPLMSPDIFKSRVFPMIDKGEKVFLIVIDNLRVDQWRILSEELAELFDIDEDFYMTILPTATQYARNAIFSGLMPLQIAQMFPDLWVDEDEEEGKNLSEKPLIQTQIDRYRRHDKFSYHKIFDSNGALTLSWFRHNVLSDVFRELAKSDYKIILTTDHGSIRTTKPVKIIGDRNTNTNLRYKLGKNLNYNSKEVFTIKAPQQAQLPAPNLSTSYVFATGNSFFAYPNNYNYYVSYYKDTFQHGGISIEEMIVPIITLTPKSVKLTQNTKR